MGGRCQGHGLSRKLADSRDGAHDRYSSDFDNESRLLAYSKIFCGRFASIFLLFVAYLSAFVEAAKARSLNSRNVHKDIFTAFVGLNKSIPFSRIEPLYSTCRHVRSPLESYGFNLVRQPGTLQEKSASPPFWPAP